MTGGRPIIRIGTRASALAMWQSEHVRTLLLKLRPDIAFEFNVIKTTGDKLLDAPLSMIGDKGLFTRQIETALIEGAADLAVHSLKDLPTAVPAGLTVGAVMAREDVRDAFLSKSGARFFDLPKGARIGTCSLRRQAQILALRPDVAFEDLRGNLDTRLRKLDENPRLDAIVLAHAGLKRMGWADRVTHLFETAEILPAVGQGAMAVEIREDDDFVRELVFTLEDAASRAGTTAERALLARLEGGCQVPIGAYGRIEGGLLALDGLVASLDGTRVFRGRVEGAVENARSLGEQLAEQLASRGAAEVLDEIIKSARGGK